MNTLSRSSVLILFWIIALYFGFNSQSQSQDLTGVWQGEYVYQNTRYSIELNLEEDKTRGLITGVSFTKMGFSILNKPQLFITLGVVKDGKIMLSQVATLDPKQDFSKPQSAFHDGLRTVDRWLFIHMWMSLSESGGTKTLSGNCKYNDFTSGTIHLTQKAAAMKEEYVGKANRALSSLQFVSKEYLNNSTKTESLKENTDGWLKYSIKNNGNYYFKDIKTDIYLVNDPQKSVSIDFHGTEMSGVGIKRELGYGQKLESKILVTTKYGLPRDSLKINLTLESMYGVRFCNWVIALPTEKLINESATSLEPDWSCERLKAIDSYYGISNYKNDIRAQLSPLAAAGDFKAKIWEAIFICSGLGGYEADELLAFSKARANRAINEVNELAKKGDAEAIYLVSMCYRLNMLGNNKDKADFMLNEAVKKNFPPAIYSFALYRLFEKKYNDAKYNLEKVLMLDLQIAQFQLGLMYENGWNVPIDITKATGYYEKLAAIGYPNAQLKLADLYTKGTLVTANQPKAIEYAKAAVKLNYSSAKIALGNIYMADPKNTKFMEGFKLKKEAAQQGNFDAMFELGLTYLFSTNTQLPKNDSIGLKYIREAAHAQQPNAMHLYGVLYAEGSKIAKDEFLARFWLNQAVEKGVGEGIKNIINLGDPLGDFLNGVLSYKPSIYYEKINQYGRVIETGYVDNSIFDYGINGILEFWIKGRQFKQPIINDVRLIYERGNTSVYGGMLTSTLRLPFPFIKNDIVDMYAAGKISLGRIISTFHGSVGPEGLNNSDYRMFSIDPEWPHGAVMAKLEGKSYVAIGKTYTGANTDVDGSLVLAVNDLDYTNNQGYFDIKVNVFDGQEK